MFDQLHRFVLFLAAMPLVLSLAGCDSDAAAAAQTILLEQHTLKDPGSRNMDSHTILAPRGWEVKGSAFWANPKFFRVHPSQNIAVLGPQGQVVEIAPMLAATDIFPSQLSMQNGFRRPAEGTVDSGKPVVYIPASLDEWGQFMKKHRIAGPHPDAKNIQIEAVKDVPELTQFMKKALEPIKRQQAEAAALLGVANGAFADGAGFSMMATFELDGKQYEQLFVWMVGVIGQDSSAGRQLFWTLEPNISFRALAGTLKEQMPLLMTIVNSVRMTPEWARMKAKHIARMETIDIEAFVKGAAIKAQFSKDMRQIISQTHQNTQDARDKGHDAFMKGMRETDDFVEPDSDKPPIQLPIHYKHVWRSDNGNLYLTNDANEDPRVGSTETWKQLERAGN